MPRSALRPPVARMVGSRALCELYRVSTPPTNHCILCTGCRKRAEEQHERRRESAVESASAAVGWLGAIRVAAALSVSGERTF